MRKLSSLSLCLVLVAVATASAQVPIVPGSTDVKINEFNIGNNNQWFEIAHLGDPNAGANIVDISGWYLWGYWENNFDTIPEVFFQFPGTPGSGTTLIAPGEFIIVQEAALGAGPTVPATQPATGLATQVYTLVGGMFDNTTTPPTITGSMPMGGIPWFTGLQGSAVLCDGNGNGIDYVAWSNTNNLEAEFELATRLNLFGGAAGTPTNWTPQTPSGASPSGFTTIGLPDFNGVGGGSNAPISYRHQLADNDNASDWTNDGMTGTPGAPNPFQTRLSSGTCTNPGTDPFNGGAALPLVAQFTPTVTSGCGPTLIGFQNTSISQCELGAGGIVQWDFDVSGAGDMSNNWHDNRTFSSPQDVQLTILNAIGEFATSAVQTINIVAAGGVAAPAVIPYIENFENFPPLIPNVCGMGAGPANVPDPLLTAWEFRGNSANSRLRIYDSTTTTAFAFPPDPVGSFGPLAAVLDSSPGSVLATNTLFLHIDGSSSNSSTGDWRIDFWVVENFDEVHSEDRIALQDGLTPGNGVDNTGATTGVPGVDGFMEVHLFDWNAVVAPAGNGASPGNQNRQWVNFNFLVDSQFVSDVQTGVYTNVGGGGPVASWDARQSPDARLIWGQRDNVCYNCNDGLLIDNVRIVPDPAPAGPGQPAQPGIAALDINGALNANLNPVPFGNPAPTDPNGPYFADASNGTLDITVEGPALAPIILITGPSNPGVATFPGIGQIDVGTFAVPIPIVTIFSDGLGGTGFLPQAFITTPFGFTDITISFGPGIVVPGAQLGFQGAVIQPGTGFPAMSNSVVVTF